DDDEPPVAGSGGGVEEVCACPEKMLRNVVEDPVEELRIDARVQVTVSADQSLIRGPQEERNERMDLRVQDARVVVIARFERAWLDQCGVQARQSLDGRGDVGHGQAAQSVRWQSPPC